MTNPFRLDSALAYLIALLTGGATVAICGFYLLATHQNRWNAQAREIQALLDGERLVRRDLEESIRSAERSLADQRRANAEQISQARRLGEIEGAAKSRDSAGGVRLQEEALCRQFARYREELRAALNQRWKGRRWDTLVLANRVVLREAEFRSLLADGLRVAVPNGVRLIPLAQLPASLMTECGYVVGPAEASARRRLEGVPGLHLSRAEGAPSLYQIGAAPEAAPQTETGAAIPVGPTMEPGNPGPSRRRIVAGLESLAEQIVDLQSRRSDLMEEANELRRNEGRQRRPNYQIPDSLLRQADHVSAQIDQLLEQMRQLEAQLP